MAETHGKGEAKKSPKKVIMIIAVVVLAIAGGAAGSYFLLSKQADTGHKQESEAKRGKEAHKGNAAHDADADHEKIAEPDIYYDLPTPLLVNFPAGSGAKVIKISLTILTNGGASVEAMRKHEPMIRNNLLMAISAVGADKAKTLEGKQALRATMQAEIGKVLEKMTGKNPVKEVYFTEFVMQ
ncbi:flagellar basal body-associated FliL family protein [Methylomonas montana]|uniref:flagellar basal body-associated FliL family protein n=1 Tax=Methylomonas montana TaxID=3058963 RepID=UPI00265B2304|nr:flagellar basal body-associated FliL family protein [Methylomonas montana]WKJ91058.1 flagellar basal body-associated FliL family protein [Methylomonas montana]